MARHKRKLLTSITILEFSDGQMEVRGPTKDLLRFRHIMNTAERIVLNALAEKRVKEHEKPDILVVGELN